MRLALRHTRGNQAQAARVLGISRQTLRAKTREFGLAAGGSPEGAADGED
jgi:two-component system nitrogen regulation response regulator GlnG